MKKILFFILIMTMLLPSAACAKAETEAADGKAKITVTVDGEAVEFDIEPVIENDRALVPVRAIFEKLGAEVSWFEDSRTVAANKYADENTLISIALQIGSNEMKKKIFRTGGTAALLDSEEAIELDSPAIIVNDRTLVPLRAISEAFDYAVDWEGETRTVSINTPLTVSAPTPAPVEGGYAEQLMDRLPKDENYVISPLSLKMAMLMAANGAEGETKEEMHQTFNIDFLDAYNEQAKELIERLNSVEDGEVDIANSIWFNKDFYKNIPEADFSEDFRNIVSEYYNGAADVVTNKDSAERVNDWVKDKTNGKITSLVPESQRKYLAALVNAIYMKADWVNQFDANDTFKETFTDINGKETEIEFMHQTDHFNYFADGENKIIELPYRNGLSMYVVLGNFGIGADSIASMASEYKKVEVSIPKFKIEYSKELNDILKDMGVEKAFSDDAEFEKMVENVPDTVKIDKVLQKAIIEVDEKGTEAAAATYVGMVGLTSLPMPEEIVEFKADKPFTYYIADKISGETLFCGQYVKAE